MKIAFIVQAFRQGGANRSLQYLLQALDGTENDVSLFALSHQGPYRSVFERYHIVPEDFLASTLLADLSQEPPSIRRLVRWVLRTLFRLLRISGISTHNLFFHNARRCIEQQGFDVVVAFQEGTVTDFVAPLGVSRKLAWIHSDYANYLTLAEKKPELTMYSRFEGIVCVSEFTASRFRELLPGLNSRVEVINNVMGQESIRHQAMQPAVHPLFVKEGYTLISVGRLDPVKRFAHIPAIAAQLKSSGLKFRWFIIGSGPERENIAKLQNDFGVTDCVVMLGELNNPYTIMAASDVLISLSESEACPMGVQEAKILGVPVLSTDYGSAKEFVIEGEGGCVVKLNGLTGKLTEWLSNRDTIAGLKDEIASYHFDQQRIVDQLLELMRSR